MLNSLGVIRYWPAAMSRAPCHRLMGAWDCNSESMIDANTHKHLHTPQIPPGVPTTALRSSLTARVTYMLQWASAEGCLQVRNIHMNKGRLILLKQMTEMILCFEISIVGIFIREVFLLKGSSDSTPTQQLQNEMAGRWRAEKHIRSQKRGVKTARKW